PYAELKPSVDEAYKTIGAQVTVPGFRQGKIPARIIDQRIGRPTVIQEAINNGLDGFYRDAVEENDLKPLGQPEVEISEVPGLDGTEDGDLVFTVDVDVRPEITLPAYDSITVEVDP
ncbi:trigger factor, partial [Burkholderia multivorans]